MEEILTVIDAHRAYLGALKTRGALIASGPLDPRSGGALLLRVPEDAVQPTLDRTRVEDPFTRTGMAQYELLLWVVVIGPDELDRL